MFRGRKQSEGGSSSTSGVSIASKTITFEGGAVLEVTFPMQEKKKASAQKRSATKKQQPVNHGTASDNRDFEDIDPISSDENDDIFGRKLQIKRQDVKKSPLRPTNGSKTITPGVVIPAPMMVAPEMRSSGALEEKFITGFPSREKISWASLLTRGKKVEAAKPEDLKQPQNETIPAPQHVDTPTPEAPVAQETEMVQQAVTFAAAVDERKFELESSYKEPEELFSRVYPPSPDLFARVYTPSPEGAALEGMTQAVAAAGNDVDGGAEEIKEQSQKSAVNDDDSQQDLFGDYYKSLHNVIRAEVPEKNKATESEEENSELVLELAAEDSASQENRGALAEMTQDEGEILPVARFNESNDSESSNLEELCTPFLSNNPVVVRIPFEQWDATKENWASPVHGSERAEVFEEDERDFAGDATQVE